jgi:hypothetical protein
MLAGDDLISPISQQSHALLQEIWIRDACGRNDSDASAGF